MVETDLATLDSQLSTFIWHSQEQQRGLDCNLLDKRLHAVLGPDGGGAARRPYGLRAVRRRADLSIKMRTRWTLATQTVPRDETRVQRHGGGNKAQRR